MTAIQSALDLPQAPPGAIAVTDESYELFREMLEIAHGTAEIRPESLRKILAMERTEAILAKKLHCFIGTQGPWIRMQAPEQKPFLTELTATLVNAGVLRRPLMRGH